MLKNKWFVFSVCLFVIPLVVDVMFYNQLPAHIPTHFDVNNQVDGTMSKFVGLFGVFGFCFILHVFCCFMTMKDPKSNNIPSFIMRILFMICPLVCMCVNFISIYYGLGHSMNVGLFINLLVSILIIVLGNYLPKIKRNYVVGIKTSWALNSDENWNRSNRFGGYCMVLAGIFYFISSLFGNMGIGICVLIVACFCPIIYSYLLFKRGI